VLSGCRAMHYLKKPLGFKGCAWCLWVLAILFSAVNAHGMCRPDWDKHVSAEPVLTSDYPQHQGKTIAAIRYKVVPVFDPENPDENNGLFRFLNKLHINTRASVIEKLLLFKKGDVLNVDTVAETERLLRALPYLSHAAVKVGQVCGDNIALVVVIRDAWTLEPLVNYSREGGDTKSGFGFKEGNVMGRGAAVWFRIDKSQARTRAQYNIASPHLWGTRMRFRVGFAENSDGQESTFQLEQPFFSLYSVWAMGVSSTDATQVEKIRFADTVVSRYKRSFMRHTAYVGRNIHNTSEAVHRLSLGLAHEVDDYYEDEQTTYGVPENFRFSYPWLKYQYLETHFGVYKNLDSLHRVEDVPLGADGSILLGYGSGILENDYDVFRMLGNYSDVLGVGENHLIKLKVHSEITNVPSHQTLGWAKWGAEVSYYQLKGENHRYFAALSYYQGHNLLQHEELTAGGESGLRGYPLDYQRGDKRILATYERRYVTPWHIFNLMRVGAVGFLDAGRAWGVARYGRSA